MFAHRKPYGQLFGHAQFTDSALPSHTTQWAQTPFEFAIQWSTLEIRQSSFPNVLLAASQCWKFLRASEDNKMKSLNNVVKIKLDFTKVGAPLCARLAQAIFADVCKIECGIFA